jgi:hypothetical protein
VKFFSHLNADALEYVTVFHRWIRERELDELLVDVADYSHVKHGPEVVLIGHESDYVIDRGSGRLGLLYAQKRPRIVAGNPWLAALERALRAAVKLQNEPGPTVPLSFRADEFTLGVADRLAAPNDSVTFERLAPGLRNALDALLGATPFSVAHVARPRALFSVEVKAPGAPPVAELLARVSALAA